MKVAIIQPLERTLCLGLGINTCAESVPFQVTPVDENEGSKTSFDTFCEQFQWKCDCTVEKYIDCLSKEDLNEVKLSFEWSNDTGKLVFRLEGSVLQGLRRAFGDTIHVELKIKNAVVLNENDDKITDISSHVIFSKKMLICMSTDQECICNDDNMEIPKSWNLFMSKLNALSTIGLYADIVVYICFEELVFAEPLNRRRTTSQCDVSEKILEENIETDVTIVAMYDAEIQSHKSLLSAHSPVFASMFLNDCQERSTSRIKIDEMSEEGVYAFLDYMYYGDLAVAKDTSVIVFELFEAGHNYKIQPLEEITKMIMLQKSNDWFDVNVALRIFSIYGKQERFKNLKIKAVQVMKANRYDLERSKDYQKLFETDPKTAMELCKAFWT